METLTSLAFMDPTTRLSSRRALDEVANLFSPENTSYGVVMIDLTGFKRVNDEGSHADGDAALRLVGNTLTKMCGQHTETPSGLPFRYGGDEFCILVPADGFETFVQKDNLELLRWPEFSSNQKNLGFKASVGLADPDRTVGIPILIQRADAAAKVSKQREDQVVRWSTTLVQAEMISRRRRCPECSATVTIQVQETRLNSALYCANCRATIVGAESPDGASLRDKLPKIPG